jgi:hypothetical protein
MWRLPDPPNSLHKRAPFRIPSLFSQNLPQMLVNPDRSLFCVRSLLGASSADYIPPEDPLSQSPPAARDDRFLGPDPFDVTVQTPPQSPPPKASIRKTPFAAYLNPFVKQTREMERWILTETEKLVNQEVSAMLGHSPKKKGTFRMHVF